MKMFFVHWDQVQDITLRLIKQIPGDKLDLKPTPENFSMKELVTHIYQTEKVFIETTLKGEIKMEDFAKYPPPEIKTVDDLYNYAKAIHEETDKKIASLSNEELTTKIIKAPWGDMPIFFHINGAYEHLWHHRGQLYVYLRLAGVKDPVFVFDYAKMPQPVQ